MKKKRINQGRTRNIIKGIVISFIITILLFLLFSIIFSTTMFPDEFIIGIVKITVIISIVFSSIISSKNMKNMGWINGFFIGCIYSIMVCIIGSILTGNIFFIFKKINLILVNLFTGIIGGIVGINIKSKEINNERV